MQLHIFSQLTINHYGEETLEGKFKGSASVI